MEPPLPGGAPHQKIGFDDQDIRAVGYEPRAHRQFLADYYIGALDGQPRGLIFNRDKDSGDARICGTLVSLLGLETALESQDSARIEDAIDRILLLHGLIFSFGGIPLLFNGDALGTLNDYSYREDPGKQNDSRWVHRGRIDWVRAERRKQPGTIEYTLFTQIQKLIAVRRELPAFADFNNRELLPLDNPHLFGLLRSNPQRPSDQVVVIANFDTRPHVLHIQSLTRCGINPLARLVDRRSGRAPALQDGIMSVGALQFHWLSET